MRTGMCLPPAARGVRPVHIAAAPERPPWASELWQLDGRAYALHYDPDPLSDGAMCLYVGSTDDATDRHVVTLRRMRFDAGRCTACTCTAPRPCPHLEIARCWIIAHTPSGLRTADALLHDALEELACGQPREALDHARQAYALARPHLADWFCAEAVVHAAADLEERIRNFYAIPDAERTE